MKNKTLYLMAAAALFAAGCAKTAGTSANQEDKEFLEDWVKQYPDATLKDGIYILAETEGSGEEWNANNSYVFVNTTVRDLDGDITSNNDEAIDKQLKGDDFDEADYYGPRAYAVGAGSSYAGFDRILSGMKVGGTRTAIVPSWLMTLQRYGTEEEYFAAESSAESTLYTVTLRGQASDITAWEREQLAAYNQKELGGVPAGTAPDADNFQPDLFFFLSHNPDPEATAMPSDTTVKLNYTGRLLNGQVFDTTIRDTALVHHIAVEGKTYAPVSITWAGSWSELSMSGSSSLISGFKGALYLMHPGEKATVIFASNYGYSSSGSGSRIPGYAPLRFDLEIVPAE